MAGAISSREVATTTTSPAISNSNSRIIKAAVVTIIVVEVAEVTIKTSQAEAVEVVEVIGREAAAEAVIKARMTITVKVETRVAPGDRISRMKSQRRRRERETRSISFTSFARSGIKSL